MSNYDEIKAHLANARSFLDVGDVAEADRIIREDCIPLGLTLMDIDIGLTPYHRELLREHSKATRSTSMPACSSCGSTDVTRSKRVPAFSCGTCGSVFRVRGAS